MAAVREHADDAGSISSVPASTFDADSEPEEMPQAVAAPVNPDTGTSAKAREAQAESARTRQDIAQRRAPARQTSPPAEPQPAQQSQAQSSSAAQEPAREPAVDPDDVPPPSYSEAIRREPRPDDPDRFAWRQGIAQGSLDMDSFSRLVSPTSERPTQGSPQTSEIHREAPSISSPPPVENERSPIAHQADAGPQYGSVPPAFAQDREAQRMADESDSSEDTSDSEHEGGWFGRKWGRRKTHRHGRDHGRRGGRGGRGGRRGGSGRGRGFGRRDRFPRWSESYEKRRNRRLKQLLIALLVLGLFAGIAWALYAIWDFFAHLQIGTGHEPPQHYPSPGGDPSRGPGEPIENPHNDPPVAGYPDLRRSSVCQSPGPWTEWNSYSFSSLHSLHLREYLDHTYTTGKIRILRAQPDQPFNVTVFLSMAVDSDWTLDAIHFSVDDKENFTYDNGLTLDEPRFYQGPPSKSDRACLDVDIVIMIRPEVDFQNLVLETAHLSIDVDEDVFNDTGAQDEALHISNTTVLQTYAAKVTVGYLSSRKIVIRTHSGRVEGAFSLYDLLDIKTDSGSITGTVAPKEALKDDPTHPAVLNVASHSGRIEIDEPTSGVEIPNRIFRTHVHTDSSAISGSFIFGSNARFESRAGRLEATLLPFLFDPPSSSVPQIDSPQEPDLPTPPTPPTPPTAPSPPSLAPIPIDPAAADFPFPSIPKIPKIPSIPSIPKIPTIPATPKIPIPIPDDSLIDLYPTILDLSTSLASSATNLHILAPYSPSGSVGNFTMHSSHDSKSGLVELQYPAAWSGTISAESYSGKIEVTGDRLERIGGSWRWWDDVKEMTGFMEKGKWERSDTRGRVGRSTIGVGTMSGKIQIGFDI